MYTLVKGTVLRGTGGESFLLLQGMFLYQHLLHLHLQLSIPLRKVKTGAG